MGEADLPLTETEGCASCKCHWNQGAVLPPFSEANKVSPRLSKFLVDEWAFPHHGSAFQKLQWYSSYRPPAKPKCLFGHGGGSRKSVESFRAESGRHLCCYQHGTQPLPKWCLTKITRMVSSAMCWSNLRRKTPSNDHIVCRALCYCNPEHI